MTAKRLFLIILAIGILLLISPISAKMVTAKVDDKGLMYTQRDGMIGTLHTQYGSITVSNEDYNKISINDTIRYNTDMVDYFWNTFWDVEVVG